MNCDKCDKCPKDVESDFMEYPTENLCCKCMKSTFPKDPMLANAYVPWQQPDTKVYNPCKALERGTIYYELDQPYMKEGCGCND